MSLPESSGVREKVSRKDAPPSAFSLAIRCFGNNRVTIREGRADRRSAGEPETFPGRPWP